LPQLIIIVAMFALLWLFIIRPQRARAQAHRELLTRVEIGDEILTVGGLYGNVLAIDEDDDDLTVEIAPGTKVRIARRAVAAVVSPEADDEELPALEEGEAVAQDEEVRS
jgi:preprotein translocase subunit YajC